MLLIGTYQVYTSSIIFGESTGRHIIIKALCMRSRSCILMSMCGSHWGNSDARLLHCKCGAVLADAHPEKRHRPLALGELPCVRCEPHPLVRSLYRFPLLGIAFGVAVCRRAIQRAPSRCSWPFLVCLDVVGFVLRKLSLVARVALFVHGTREVTNRTLLQAVLLAWLSLGSRPILNFRIIDCIS